MTAAPPPRLETRMVGNCVKQKVSNDPLVHAGTVPKSDVLGKETVQAFISLFFISFQFNSHELKAQLLNWTMPLNVKFLLTALRLAGEVHKRAKRLRLLRGLDKKKKTTKRGQLWWGRRRNNKTECALNAELHQRPK